MEAILNLNFEMMKFSNSSFFTNFPDLRVYFKGAEKFTAEDVQKSERWAGIELSSCWLEADALATPPIVVVH